MLGLDEGVNVKTKTRYAIEMLKREDLCPKTVDLPELRIERMEYRCPELNKFFHLVVGGPWLWGGRADWDEDEWRAHVDRDELETWVGYLSGTPAGYFELEKQPSGEVQILVFGLFQQFIGKGIGGHLLTKAAERAWEMGATRVHLSTCSHDHPHALKNYLARGFRIQESDERPANPIPRSFWELVCPED